MGEKHSQFFGNRRRHRLGFTRRHPRVRRRRPDEAVRESGLAVVTGVADIQKQQLEENAKIVNSAPPSTPDEICGQLPETPGTPAWLELTTKGLLAQTPKFFDTGGEWESETLVYNASGYKKLVLNHDRA